MALIALSSDVLELVFGLLDLSDLAHLYMVGNRAFYRRLFANKCAKKCYVSMPLPTSSASAARTRVEFPRLQRLSQLTPLSYYPHLEHLHLDFSASAIVLDDVEALLTLPLRYLCLKIKNAFSLLFDHFARQIRPLNIIFPRLETLLWTDLKPLDMRICTDAVLEQIGRRLPASLSRLSLSTFSHYPYALVRALPPHISNFKISVCNDAWEEPLELPEHLQEATFAIATTPLNGATNSLPESLHTLSLQRLDPGVYFASHMNVIQFTPETVLPSQLTSLNMDRHWSFDRTAVLALPRTLLKLFVPSVNSIEESLLSHLPPLLQVLCLGNATASSDAYSKLPRTLTWLDCAFALLPDPTATLASLPPGITKFWWKGEVGLKTHEAALPRQLKHFCLHRTSIAQLATLPPKLETLIYKAPHLSSFTKKDMEQLPTTLKVFKCANVQFEFPSGENPLDNILNFPRNLSKLILDGDMTPLPEQIIPHLPRTLTMFRNSAGLISASYLHQLPPDLTILFVHSIIIDESVTKAIIEAHELAFRTPTGAYSEMSDSWIQSKLLSLPFLADSSKDEIKLTTEDWIRAATAMIPRKVKNRPCNFFTFYLTSSLIEPASKLLASLDTTLTVAQTYGTAPTPHSSLFIFMEKVNARSFITAPLAPGLTNLTKLIMKPGIDGNTHVVVNEEDLLALPSSLTHLDIDWFISVRKHFADQYPENGAILPDYENPCHYDGPQSKTLELDQLRLSMLPNLTHLSLTRLIFDLKRLLPQLPQELKELRVTRCTLNEEEFALLPRQLTLLSVQNWKYQFGENGLAPFHLLPTGLKNLSTVKPVIRLEGPCTGLLRLPPAIAPANQLGHTNISLVPDWDKYVNWFLHHWPEHVPKCELDGFTSLDASFLATLPNTVTDVSLSGNHNIVISSAPTWPRNLTRLKVGTLLFDKSSLLMLSSQIEQYDDIAMLDAEAFKILAMKLGPKSLTKIELENVALTPLGGLECLEALPKRLKSLHLPTILRISETDLKKLPSTLTSLRLDSLQRISLFQANSPSSWLTNLIEFCVPQLQLQETDLTKLAFAQNLQCLDLSFLTSFPDKAAHYLPKSLTHLNFSGASANDSCLEHLPRNLRFLKFGRIRITGAYQCEGDTVDIFSLIRAAQSRLPAELTTQPALIWEFLPDTFFRSSLPRVCSSSARHLMLPSERVDYAQVFKKQKPGIAYRTFQGDLNSTPVSISTTPSLGPASSISAQSNAKVARWIPYSLMDPSPPQKVPAENLKPVQLLWGVVKNSHFSLATLPIELESFVCHNYQRDASIPLEKLPPHLRRLTLLSYDQSLALDHVKNALPSTLTQLELNLDGFTLTDDKKPFAIEARSTLPPSLTLLSINSLVFRGIDSQSLLLEEVSGRRK